MSLNNNKFYDIRKNGKQEGDVFTSPKIACYILDLIGYTPDKNLSKCNILEPSCGDGVFVIEIIHRILVSSRFYGFDPYPVVERNIVCYDIDSEKIKCCHERIDQTFPGCAYPQFHTADFLMDEIQEKFDFIVGNPPYIRYEKIPANVRAVYKKMFATFYYRADLYVLFFEKTLKLLKPGGTHGFICANRWLKNEYGKNLRGYIAYNYRLRYIADLERSNAFQEKVLAYPAITVISNEVPSATYHYMEVTDIEQLEWKKWTIRNMSTTNDWSEMFCEISNFGSLLTIEEQNFHIGIGVATGADSIYISTTLKGVIEESRLLPAINARNLTGDKLSWNGEYLLNPFDENGNLVDLACYPKTLQYLESKKEILSNRHIAKKTPANWYRTIDKIRTDLQKAPKILLPDISGNSLLFIDEGRFYPLHNIYYITGEDIHQLKILCSILMSDFVRKQIQRISNNMNGGYARWQSQNLRKLRIPDIKGLSHEQAAILEEGYEKKDIKLINDCISYLTQKTISARESQATRKPQQLSLIFS